MDANERLVRASVAIALAARRENGLWFKPTSELDFDSYSPEGGKDDRARESAPFGYTSITVSWYALRGLERVLGRDILSRYVRADEVIDQIGNMRASSGAYGTWHDGWQASRRVVHSSRHTAVAILCQIAFADYLSAPATFEHLRPSLDWLLAGRADDGGWRHDPSSTDPTEPLTTAAVVAALCALRARFPDAFQADVQSEGRLLGAIEAATAFLKASLVENNAGRKVLWKPGHKQQAFRVPDTAEAYEFLVIAMDAAAGTPLATPLAALESDITAFLAAYDPGSDVNSDHHTLSSVLALRATCMGSHNSNCAAAAASVDVEAARARLARRIGQRRDDMRAWSWLCVLNAADRDAGAGLGNYCARVDRACKASADGRRGGQLDAALWSFVPAIAQTPILYSFSRGRPGDVPMFALDRIYRALPAVVRWPVRACGALAFILLGAFIQNSTSTLSWMRWPID